MRDERRRRVMREENHSASQGSSNNDSLDQDAATKTRSYSLDSLNENKIRLTGLIPLRGLTVAIYYTIAILLGVGLILLHDRFSSTLPFADLANSSSLGSWFMSVCLLACAMLSIIVYRIRRHKLDDYRARYRVWIWTTLLLLFFSMNTSAGFHRVASQLIEEASKQRFASHPEGWGILIWGTLIALFGTRLAFEVYRCKSSLILLISSGAALLLFGFTTLGQGPWPDSINNDLASHGCLLFSIGTFSLSLLHYARYVWLDAHGLIRHRITSSESSKVKEEPAKPKAKSSAAKKKPSVSKSSVKQTPAKEATKEESEKTEKRSWFGWGKPKETSKEESVENQAEKKTTKTRSSKPTAPKVVAKPEINEDQETKTESQKKGGWFSWGSRSTDESEAKDQTIPTSKSKSSSGAQNSLKKKLAERMNNRESKTQSTASKTTKSSHEQVAHPNPPTLKMNSTNAANSLEPEVLAEYQQLMEKEDHLMSKAERRRLKKLRRRVGKAA